MIDLQGFPTSRPTPAYDQHGQGWDRGALLWPHLTSMVKITCLTRVPTDIKDV